MLFCTLPFLCLLRPRFGKQPIKSAIDEVMNRTGIPKPHLMLAGVDINVHLAWIKIEKQHIGRMPAVIEHILKALANGMGD
jgi:hypothetical protein